MTYSIAITNNYFADQAAFIEAAGLPKNTKYKKADLYAEIETWNRMQAEWDASEPPTVQADLNAAYTADTFDNLLADWQDAKTRKKIAKTAKVSKPAIEWAAEDIAIAKNLQLETDRQNKAKLIHDLVVKYSVAAVAKLSSVNEKTIRRSYNAWRIYNSSEILRDLHAQNIISWSIINDKIATKPNQFDEKNLDALVA